ncbi:MAG TPA: phosphate ABC transporter permease subunit PstC [Caldisericia bacterium]|nr:phosphate ABC transporter permease subunit PstC [Caldisericia bacterium]
MQKKTIEQSMRFILLGTALISLLILVGIVYFIFSNGFLAFIENGLWNFLFGKEWSLANNTYGALPLIVGSIYVTVGSVLIAAPLSIAIAVFMTQVAPNFLRDIVRPCIDLLVGIPSVVYGLIGMVFLVPLIRARFGPPGYSLLAAIVVLVLMTIPTIVSVSEDTLRAVPKKYKEASLALGATKWQTIWHVILPAAKSGIISAIILGVGRAIGEAMAIYMVIGNSFSIPKSLFDPSRTLTSNIVGQIEEAAIGSTHIHALFGCGIILLFFVFIFNSISFSLGKRGVSS